MDDSVGILSGRWAGCEGADLDRLVAGCKGNLFARLVGCERDLLFGSLIGCEMMDLTGRWAGWGSDLFGTRLAAACENLLLCCDRDLLIDCEEGFMGR